MEALICRMLSSSSKSETLGMMPPLETVGGIIFRLPQKYAQARSIWESEINGSSSDDPHDRDMPAEFFGTDLESPRAEL
jgi:hypothetical protein